MTQRLLRRATADLVAIKEGLAICESHPVLAGRRLAAYRPGHGTRRKASFSIRFNACHFPLRTSDRRSPLFRTSWNEMHMHLKISGRLRMDLPELVRAV